MFVLLKTTQGLTIYSAKKAVIFIDLDRREIQRENKMAVMLKVANDNPLDASFEYRKS